MPVFVLWFAAVVLAVTSVGLLLNRDWRWNLGLLGGQYFAVFLLVLSHWSLTMAAAKLVTGWMAVAVLAMTQLEIKDEPVSEASWPEGSLFRAFAAGLVLITVTSAAQQVNGWLPSAGLPLVWGGLSLIGMGLLHLGLSVHPMRVTLGLLITLAGFETLYASLENSILVSGLLAVITLGLALTGSYLLSLNPQPVREKPVE